MKNYTGKCTTCCFKCKQEDEKISDKCMNHKEKVDYIGLLSSNGINKETLKIFCRKYEMDYREFNRMLKGNMLFDERYEYNLNREFFYDEFETYKSRFEEVGDDI